MAPARLPFLRHLAYRSASPGRLLPDEVVLTSLCIYRAGQVMGRRAAHVVC